LVAAPGRLKARLSLDGDANHEISRAEKWRRKARIGAGLIGDAPRGASLSAYDPAVVAGATYAVTVEPPGGSPSGQPSGTPVFVGKLIPVGGRDCERSEGREVCQRDVESSVPSATPSRSACRWLRPLSRRASIEGQIATVGLWFVENLPANRCPPPFPPPLSRRVRPVHPRASPMLLPLRRGHCLGLGRCDEIPLGAQ
jgi:hypothetical protein